MGGEEVFAGGAAALLATLGEEFPVPGHEVAVAVDDLAAVVDSPAQAGSLAVVRMEMNLKRSLGLFNKTCVI